jgi:hypothetical protein
VFALNRTQPYIVIVLNEKKIRFFEGVRENIAEITHEKLPVLNRFIGGEKNAEGGSSFRDDITYNYEKQKKFFREADNVLSEIIKGEKSPVILTGTESQLSMFKDISKSAENVYGTIKGSHENTPVAELAGLVWQEAKKGLARKRMQVLELLEKAVSANRYAAGFDDIWKTAKEGRGYILLVEINFAFPAMVDTHGQLVPSDIKPGEEVYDDAVDEIIELVVSGGGSVVFFENSALKKFGGAVLILRY